uniref:RNA-dependent RNA polymerase n=1 Tax=Exserohilum turcicum mitovirus 6 TaxID=3229030 RepID=A0AAU7YB72_9VIRU
MKNSKLHQDKSPFASPSKPNYTKFISIMKSFKDGYLSDSMVSLDNSFELSVLFKRVGYRLVYSCFPNIVKLNSRLKQLSIYRRLLFSMTKHHGASFAVQYMKLSALILQRFVAKNPVSSYRELDTKLPLPRLYNGLPRFIPIEDRREIRRGNAYVIKWWLTLFSVYRIVSIPGKLKLETITNPLSVEKSIIETGSIKLAHVMSKFVNRFSFKDFRSKEVWVLPIEKASPTSALSWADMFEVPKTIRDHYPTLFDEMNRFMGEDWVYARFKAYFNMYANSRLSPTRPSSTSQTNGVPDSGPMIGKLSTKSEPAGKIRVFAMVDVWTQSLLKPLHDLIFSFLKKLPNDGTFDQKAAVKRAVAKCAKFNQSFGFDLSAATDRLPIELQIAVLTPIIGAERAKLWASILISRTYFLKVKSDGDISFGNDEYKSLRYKVGQPMGALSSWGMLALTHHIIVQLAYRECYPAAPWTWYEEYEVLGDDIVLFEEHVANKYLEIMTSYGVDINLSKSVIAKNQTIEFAKNTFLNGINVSALPIKMFHNQTDRIGKINIVYYLLQSMEIRHIIRYIRNMNSFSLRIKGDYGFSLIALLTMAVSDKFPIKELLRTFTSVSVSGKISNVREAIGLLNIPYIESLLVSIFRNQEIRLTKEPLVDMAFAMDHPHSKILISNQLKDWKRKVQEAYMLYDKVTKDIIDWRLPNMPEDAKVLMWPHNLPVTDRIWDQRYYQSIYMTVRHWFDGLEELLQKITPDIAHLEISQLLEMQEKAKNFDSLTDLVPRGKSKISDNTPIALPLKPSLSAIQFLLKASKDRPLWTYDIERMSHLRYMRISRYSFTDR